MNGSGFMQGRVALTGSAALIALTLTAFGLMLGVVKPANALRRVAAILAGVILLIVFPAVVVGTWSAMLLWQRIGLVALAVLFALLLRLRRKNTRRKDT
jgi:hypothetical protein